MKQLRIAESVLRHRLTWIVLLGFMLRVYAALMRGIVNPDAVHYIYQAKALFYGDWHSLTACNLNYVSLFPVLMAAAYGVLRDWLYAGLVINLCCGTALLFPLYFILKRFFSPPLTLTTVLIYAIMPAYVSGSGDILRDPLFWFLICSGMLMFIRQWDNEAGDKRWATDVLFGCIFFLLAAWARVEGVVFIAVSPFFILISKSDRKIKRCLIFMSPLVFSMIAGLTVVAFLAHTHTGASLGQLLRLTQIWDEIFALGHQYGLLQGDLKQIMAGQSRLVAQFLKHVDNVVWMIPLNIIFVEIIEGFFFIFALIYLWGWTGIGKQMKADWRTGYFFWLSLIGVFVLYLHMIQTWLIYHRFLAIVFFPGCVFFGVGLDRILNHGWMNNRWGASKILTALVVFFLLLTIPNDLQPKEKDKAIYRQAADIIAAHKSDDAIARIAAVEARGYYWVFFYAHQNYPGSLCSRDLRGAVGDNLEDFKYYLKSVPMRYVLYEAYNWPSTSNFDPLKSLDALNLAIAGQWLTADRQKVVLLEVQ